MITLLAAFGPASKETAIFFLIAVVCFALAALSSPLAARMRGGSTGLVAVGLGLWLWPTMWNTMRAAF
jgi:hypothetical protein